MLLYGSEGCLYAANCRILLHPEAGKRKQEAQEASSWTLCKILHLFNAAVLWFCLIKPLIEHSFHSYSE